MARVVRVSVSVSVRGVGVEGGRGGAHARDLADARQVSVSLQASDI